MVKSVTVHVLQSDGSYDEGTEYIKDEKIPIHIFDGYEIGFNEIFAF